MTFLRPHKKRSHSHRNVASSDEEPYGGWDLYDDVKLKPVSQHMYRQNQGYLATPDTSPNRRRSSARSSKSTSTSPRSGAERLPRRR